MQHDTSQSKVLQKLGDEQSCTFVSFEEYCNLLLSRSALVRVHDPEAKVAGLKDPASGTCYCIQVEKLGIIR